MMMKTDQNGLAIVRNLNEETRKQGILINNTVYSLHITDNEVIITDNDDYNIIHSIQTKDFFKML